MAEESLGARIRRLREARGMTQDQLALACAMYDRRVDRTHVQRWERDKHIPSVPNFAALARVLGVSMDVLFYGWVW